MTTKPHAPEAGTSPYPLEPKSSAEDHLHSSAKPVKVGGSAETDAEKAGWSVSKKVGVGAAVGIGSAAIVAALLYARGGRKTDKE